jgi:hypothetical protein
VSHPACSLPAFLEEPLQLKKKSHFNSRRRATSTQILESTNNRVRLAASRLAGHRSLSTRCAHGQPAQTCRMGMAAHAAMPPCACLHVRASTCVPACAALRFLPLTCAHERAHVTARTRIHARARAHTHTHTHTHTKKKKNTPSEGHLDGRGEARREHVRRQLRVLRQALPRAAPMGGDSKWTDEVRMRRE